MIEPKRFVADFAAALKKFSPFATSDKTSIPSTAPRAKIPNLGVLVNALTGIEPLRQLCFFVMSHSFQHLAGVKPLRQANNLPELTPVHLSDPEINLRQQEK